MNFIKKKLKSHKKDDEEEEYEKAMYEQSLHPQHPDQKHKNTEEWQFFQQLSMKVQDTVQKTQTTLNKLKDTNVPNEEDLFDTDNDLLPRETMSYGTTKAFRAPPRPPAPSGDKAPMPIDLDFGSDFSQSSPSKLPPRPPPPGFSPSDSSALHGTPIKSFASPARPPPPHAAKMENTNVAHSQPKVFESTIPDLTSAKKTVNLLDKFSFQSDSTTTTMNANANIQDLLFLDDKDDVDPFDTSFVDVSNISSISTTVEKKRKEPQIISSENNYNPFSSSAPSDEWLSPTHSDKSKKTTTNPFFSGVLDDSKSDTYQESVTSASSHNPFSNHNPVSTEQDDFFGITIEPSSSKDNVTNDLFQTNEESPKSPEFECKGIINSAFNDNIDPEPVTDLDNNMFQEQENPLSPVHKKNLVNEVNMWDSDEINDTSVFSNDPVLSFNPPSLQEKTLDSTSLWDTDTLKTDTLLPEKVSVKEDMDKNNEENSALDLLEDSSSNKLPTHIEYSSHSSEMKLDENILQQSMNNNFSEFPLPPENEIDTANSEERSSCVVNETSNGVFSDLSEGLDSAFPAKRESIPRKESIPHKESIPRRDSIPKRESIPRKEIIPSKESTPIRESISKNENIFKEELPTTFTEDFSKPFEGENEQNAFLFKVKSNEQKTNIEFDAFAAKFDSVKDSQGSEAFDPFMTRRAPTLKKIQENLKGFDSMDEFDPFCVTHKGETNQSMMKKEPSQDSFEDYDNEVDFSVVIKPKVKDSSDVKLSTMEPPKLLPPPKTPTKAFDTPASRFNPFDKDFLDNTEISKVTEKVLETVEVEEEPVPALGEAGVRKADSVETPLSPLFDEDTSQPLEIFPTPYGKEGWEMVLRQPNKKKLTGNRFWKKIFVKLSENSILQLFNKAEDKLPFQELPLQACYSLSEVGAQQYDQYGKIFTVKLQYKFYRERVGVRPGQISKVTQGQVTSMGDVAKLGLPLQHSAQTSQLLKLGSQSYCDIKYFIQDVEDAIFRMVVHRDRVLTYKTEEVQVIAQDEFYVEQSKTGHIDKQLARVRIFFLAFITGMPSVEVGVNDIIRQGKEVVGRYDIIPVVTEEWIRLEDCEFHSCVIQDEFYKSRVIKFHPPDACLFELLRFRIRPPKNRELPLQVRVFMTVSNTRVEIRSDILVPGYSSRKQGQVPCENIQIRFPVPECWIYLFRTEKHFRYGSKKSTARRPGKIKGLERIIGAAQNLDPSLIEVSAGQAKYEHVFHAVVWRIPRLPKEGQGAYTQQLFLLRTELTSFDQIPESFEQYVDVEFTMPATYVSHTTVRSVSVTNPIPPEKYVRYVSKHEYKVEIDFKNSSDEIDGLITTPNVSVPVSTTPAVQESTEEEEKDEDSD